MSASHSRKPIVALIIMDGWGIAPDGPNNGIYLASTPNVDRITAESQKQGSYCELHAEGEYVGLPIGQMGNSEVGHTTIGAGRAIEQMLTKITRAMDDQSLFESPAMKEQLKRLKMTGGTLHLFGLISDGGVHSHIDHTIRLAKYVDAQGVPVAIHAALDGRDTPGTSAGLYLRQLQDALKDCKQVRLATLSGRSYSMDRDEKWERTAVAYDTMMHGQGPRIALEEIPAYLRSEYDKLLARGEPENDQNVTPCVIGDYHGIGEKDGITFVNFRTDRPRQLSQAIVDPASIPRDLLTPEQMRQVYFLPDGKQFPKGNVVSMREYSQRHALLMGSAMSLGDEDSAYPTLSDVIAKSGMTQYHGAEGEKYNHVTTFANGGRDAAAPGEVFERTPSLKLALGESYAHHPVMSLPAVTDAAVAAITSGKYDFVLVNFANVDMVGHTGVPSSVIKAAEAVDGAVGKIEQALRDVGGVGLYTADHGNGEELYFPDGAAHTAHTTNPVPLAITGTNLHMRQRSHDERAASLADLAPTVIALLGLPVPKEMEGAPLLDMPQERQRMVASR